MLAPRIVPADSKEDKLAGLRADDPVDRREAQIEDVVFLSRTSIGRRSTRQAYRTRPASNAILWKSSFERPAG